MTRSSSANSFAFGLVSSANVAAHFSSRTRTTYGYKRKQFFTTKAEHIFYKELLQVVGNDYFVFAQVHLSTIFDEKVRGQNWRASRAHISLKSVDFVLCDKEYVSPKLAIELDDWSHAHADRRKRDAEVERIFLEAGIPLLRTTDSQGLAEKLRAKLTPQQEF